MYDDGFKNLAKSIELILDKVPDMDEHELLVHQREQLKTLISLEKHFRDELVAHQKGPKVFEAFIGHIVNIKGNILAARPYFRERQTTFTNKISGALKQGSCTALYKYRVNWSFIQWALDSFPWISKNLELSDTASRISNLRQEILQENLPLAISQARIFFRSTPRSHLTFLDVVQIQCQSLLLAIDKFVPQKEKGFTEAQSLANYRTFRAVAIGIMRRDRVNEYSQTLMHFYPLDKQKIYWANKTLRKYLDKVDFNEIARDINVNLPEAKHTDAEEVSQILAAAGLVSGDYSNLEDGESEGETVIDLAVSSDETRPDVQAEQEESYNSMFNAIHGLSAIEIKLLKLKGIKYE